MDDAQRVEVRFAALEIVLRLLLERQLLGLVAENDDDSASEKRIKAFRELALHEIHSQFPRVTDFNPQPLVAEMTAELDRVLEGLLPRLQTAAAVRLIVSDGPSLEPQ